MRIGIAVLAALALSASLSPATAADPEPIPGPYGVTMGQPVRDDAWCRTLIPNRKGDAAEADSIMLDDVVDLGQYGYYDLALRPKWRRQSTLDSSGNTHVHGLHWTVPLLYTGTRRSDPEMVQRFFDLIDDWLSKHRKKKTRTWSVTQPIIAGERLWTLTCASDISDGTKFVKATRKEAITQIKGWRIGSGTNNTGIHSQGAALAAFCYLGDTARRDRAANNLANLADYLVLPDGSDREGSPWYAYYTLRLLGNLQSVYERCGLPFDSIQAAIGRTESFLAAAVDPDFNLVMTGDTHRATLSKKWFPAGSPAQWAAASGNDGTPPAKLYNLFAGGYVFGRSGWTSGDQKPASFYSVRAARPYVTFHVHSDLGSVTFHSRGTEWIGDPGPYRYDESAIRDYVVSRSGHNVIRVIEKPKKKPKKKSKKTKRTERAQIASVRAQLRRSGLIKASAGSPDTTCLRDGTYSAAKIRRCVYYDTGIDALVVTDRVRARKRVRIDQRWQIPPGVRVQKAADGATLTSTGSAAAVKFAGGGKVRTFRPNSGRPDGWFTQGYGELRRGTVLQRGQLLPKGSVVNWMTVVAAGATPPQVQTGEQVSVTRQGRTAVLSLP